MPDKYVSRRELVEKLGIHYQTVYNLVKKNKIETIKVGSISKYNLGKYLDDNKLSIDNNKRNICYCRVSSQKQSEDLKRQVEIMKEKYPNHEIITDIGSGLNLKREGLKKIIELGISGEIQEVVVTYKDRLARFGYDLIEMLLEKYSEAKIIVMNKNVNETQEEELVRDILSIMNVYVAKINGMRNRHIKTKK